MSDRHAAARGQGASKTKPREESVPVREVGLPGAIPPSETVDEPTPGLMSEWTSGPDFRVSRVTAGIIVTAALVLIIGAFSFGHAAGRRVGEREAAELARQLNPVEDPLNRDTPKEPPQPRVKQDTPPSPVADSEESLTPQGILLGDPRERGLNYLHLGIFPRTDAQAAVEFLAANGVQSFAVAVDSNDSGANNPDPGRKYALYVLPGITGSEFRRGVTKKTNLEAEVARLGALWQKNHRGPSNFSKTMWAKYD